MKKKQILILSIVLVVAIAVSLFFFLPKGGSAAVKMGATASPHAEVLEFLKPLLAEKGFTLEIVVFNDYVVPNTSTESGELAANYFQHKPYMTDFNTERGTHLVATIPVHFEPMAIYAGKSSSLTEIPDGATIAVPNDPTNEARALLLLEANGIITIAEGKGLSATKLDILENPYNIKLEEIEAAQVPRILPDVDFAVMNGNYALEVNLFASKDGLASEALDSLAAETYINYVVVKEGNENTKFMQALREVINTDAVRKFIADKYQGAVVAAF